MASISYTRPIDPHVHLRGNEYLEYQFLKIGFRDALATGIISVGEQPMSRLLNLD